MGALRPELILHVGTTKTGTTTLQHACNASRGSLLAKGILYPDVDLDRGSSPKHQWLTNLLLAEDLQEFGNRVAAVARQAKATNACRVILSTEGLFNHWFDYSQASKAALARLKDNFDVTVWVVFREPVSWAMSMYVEALKNPPFHLAPVYSTAEPAESVVDHVYFATRLRYDKFVQDVETVFGAGTVHAMRYESGDILEQARTFLGVDASTLASAGDRNRSLSVLAVDLLRRLNSMGIAGEERERVVSQIVELDRTLGATSEPVKPSPEVRGKVLALSRESESFLGKRFGIGWAESR